MSVVILGGNECMVRRYEELCKSYDCKAKVYAKMERGMQNIGSPDLLVLFTGTMSHKRNINIVRSHTSSMAALRGILETHAEAARV